MTEERIKSDLERNLEAMGHIFVQNVPHDDKFFDVLAELRKKYGYIMSAYPAYDQNGNILDRTAAVYTKKQSKEQTKTTFPYQKESSAEVFSSTQPQ